MAHADVFQKLSKHSSDDRIDYEPVKSEVRSPKSSLDKRTRETIKVMGEQIVELREIVEKQTDTIIKLKDQVIDLKNKNVELEGNQRMTHIDQKDLAHQLRLLKSIVNSEQFVQAKTQTIEDIERKFINNYEDNTVLKQAAMDTVSELAEVASPVQAAPMPVAKDEDPRSAESIAKEFIFGRMPKLLNLD